MAIAEAIAMAKNAGVPIDALYQTLKTCSADSYVLRALENVVLNGDCPAITVHAIKDLYCALDSARSVHQAMPLTSLCAEIYELADQKLGGLRGSNDVVRFYLEAGGTPKKI